MEVYYEKYQDLAKIQQEDRKIVDIWKENAEKAKENYKRIMNELEEEKRRNEKREKDLEDQHKAEMKIKETEFTGKMQKLH